MNTKLLMLGLLTILLVPTVSAATSLVIPFNWVPSCLNSSDLYLESQIFDSSEVHDFNQTIACESGFCDDTYKQCVPIARNWMPESIYIVLQVMAFVGMFMSLYLRKKNNEYSVLLPVITFILFLSCMLIAVDVDPIFGAGVNQTNTIPYLIYLNAGMAAMAFIIMVVQMLTRPLEELDALNS